MTTQSQYFKNYAEIRSIIYGAILDAARVYSPEEQYAAYSTNMSLVGYAGWLATEATMAIEKKMEIRGSLYTPAPATTTIVRATSRHEELAALIKPGVVEVTPVPVALG